MKEKDFIFGEKDIEKMFKIFRENNFRENPVCEYVLGVGIMYQQQYLNICLRRYTNRLQASSWCCCLVRAQSNRHKIILKRE